MSDVRYRIRHLQKRRFLVQVLAIFVYDVVYDIVRNIVGFAEILYYMQMEYWYYTILYAYIVCFVGIIRYCTPISTKTYADTIRCRTQYHKLRCDVRYACLGLRSRRTYPWSAHRPCPMILCPAGWSVLHRDSPDALSLSVACATANVSGGSLVTSKNRNFKL